MKLFEVNGFYAGYGKKQIVSDVSFILESQTLTGLLGANGSGKTTLLKGLCHLIPHTGSCTLAAANCAAADSALHGTKQKAPGSTICLDSLNHRQLARYLSYIPQKSSVGMALPVLDVVLMGFQPFLPFLARAGKMHRETALGALEAVGMQDFARCDFSALSEGQKQLCILARTLVQDTSVLLLDEPDSALDYANRSRILNILQKIVYDKSKAGLLILHDPALALNCCSQILLMRDGKLIGSVRPAADSDAVICELLSRLYGPVHVFRHDGHFFVYQGGSHAT